MHAHTQVSFLIEDKRNLFLMIHTEGSIKCYATCFTATLQFLWGSDSITVCGDQMSEESRKAATQCASSVYLYFSQEMMTTQAPVQLSNSMLPIQTSEGNFSHKQIMSDLFLLIALASKEPFVQEHKIKFKSLKSVKKKLSAQ